MRRFAILLAAMVGVAGMFAALAQAATVQSLDAKVSPGKAGTKKRPKSVLLQVRIQTGTDDTSAPPVTRQTVIYTPKLLKINSKYFRSCSLKTLNDPKKGPKRCPSGSKVGTGSAVGLAGTARIPFQVTAFNGTKGKKLELYLVSKAAGVNIRKAIEGTLSRASGSFGSKLTVRIPSDLQEVAGLPVPLVDFKANLRATRRVKIGRKHRRVGYLESVGCPSNKKLAFRSINTYANLASRPAPGPESADAFAKCKK